MTARVSVRKLVGLALIVTAAGAGFVFVLPALRTRPSGDTFSFSLRTPSSRLPVASNPNLPTIPNRNLTLQLNDEFRRSLVNEIQDPANLTKETIRAFFLTKAPDSVADGFEALLKNPSSPLAATVADNEIRVGAGDSAQDRRFYILDLAQLALRHFNGSRNPAFVLANAIQTNDTALLEEERDRFAAAEQALLALAPPPSWLAFHKDLLLTFRQQRMVLDLAAQDIAASGDSDDSAALLVAIQQQLTLSTRLAELTARANNELFAIVNASRTP